MKTFSHYRIGFSRDLRNEMGGITWGDISTNLLEDARAPWSFMEGPSDALTSEQLESYDAMLIAAPQVPGDAVLMASKTPSIIARFGVGVDAVDLDACTERGIIVTNTPDGARRPVAQAALALTLATVHHLSAKDLMVRLGNWDEKLSWNGRSLNGAVVGLIGLGNVGSEFARLVKIFDVTLQAYDPYQKPEAFTKVGAAPCGLEELLRTSDVIVVFTPLTSETHHLLNASNMGMIKHGAYLVNISRGEVIEHSALVAALAERRLAGAGLDVFEVEPLPKSDPLINMPNVVLAPHALSWTDEMARGNGASAIRAILDVRDGYQPKFVVNRAVLNHPRVAHLRRRDEEVTTATTPVVAESAAVTHAIQA